MIIGHVGIPEVLIVAGVFLNGVNFGEDDVQRVSHLLMNFLRFAAFDEMRLVTVTGVELDEIVVTHAAGNGGIGDLVAIEMEDGQNGAVASRIEEFVRMPASGEWAGFGFAVADDTADEQIGIVEGRAVGMGDGIAEFAAFVNRAGGFRRDMARDSSGKGKLLEEFAEAFFRLRNVRVEFAVGSFEISVGDEAGTAVSGTSDVDDVQVVESDEAIQMDVDEIETGRGTPVAKEARFDVLELEWFTQERIRAEIDLTDREIVGGAPVSVHFS